MAALSSHWYLGLSLDVTLPESFTVHSEATTQLLSIYPTVNFYIALLLAYIICLLFIII